MDICKGYTFDDVLLIPKHSTIKSRSEIDTSVNLGKGIQLTIPIISANMKNVTGYVMAAKIAQLGGLPILHRFHNSLKEHLDEFERAANLASNKSKNIGVSVGVNGLSQELIDAYFSRTDIPHIICVDIAHGDSDACAKTTEYIAKTYPKALLISGNVASADGAQTLYDAGADVIKLNVGNGSLCTTRIETGNGVPTLTAISEVHKWRVDKNINVKLICDGGMRTAGDIVKALVFTDAVMLGNLLAGTDEAPGDIITADGKQYKQYAGSSTHKTSHIEGVVGLIERRGSVSKVIERLIDGITSGLSYQNSKNLAELKRDPKFVSISNAGLIESKPHDVVLR